MTVEPPLRRCRDQLRSRSATELRDAVARRTVVHHVDAVGAEPDGLVHAAALGDTAVVFVRYGAQVVVEAPPTRDRVAVTVPLGPMLVGMGRGPAAARETGFALGQGVRTVMRPDPFRGALVVSTRAARLEERFAALTGRVGGPPISFDVTAGSPTVGPPALLAAGWRTVCEVLGELDGAPAPALARSLEDGLLDAILLGLPHTATGELRAPATPRTSDVAARARAWIEEHHAEPITVGDVARALRISVRQLQHLFAAEYGRPVTRMLRDVRLARAHTLLSTATAGTSVSAVASACGFAHLGRFAADYHRRYGRYPSQTVRGRSA